MLARLPHFSSLRLQRPMTVAVRATEPEAPPPSNRKNNADGAEQRRQSAASASSRSREDGAEQRGGPGGRGSGGRGPQARRSQNSPSGPSKPRPSSPRPTDGANQGNTSTTDAPARNDKRSNSNRTFNASWRGNNNNSNSNSARSSAPAVAPTDTWAEIKEDAAASGQSHVDLQRTVDLLKDSVKFHRAQTDRRLVLDLSKAIVEHPNADSKSLIWALWSMAESRQSDPKVVDKILGLLRFRVPEFNESAVSTLLYSAGTMDAPLPFELVEACVKILEDRGVSPRAKPLQLSSILFGLARHGDRKLFARAEAILRPLLIAKLFRGDVQAHLTLSVLRSLGAVRMPVDPALMDALMFSFRSQGPLRVGTINMVLTVLTQLNETKRAIAFLEEHRAPLLTELKSGSIDAAQANDLLSSYSAQRVSETEPVDVELARALLEPILAQPENLRGKLSFVLWSLSKLDLKEEFVHAEAVLRPRVLRQIQDGEALVHNVGALVYSYGRMRHYIDPTLCQALVEFVLENGREFTHLSGSSVLWGLARLGASDVFMRVKDTLSPVLVDAVKSSTITPKALDNAVWAFCEVGTAPPAALFAALDASFENSEASFDLLHRALTWFYCKAVLTQTPSPAHFAIVASLIRTHGRSLTLPKLSLFAWCLGVMLCAAPGVSLQPKFWECWREVVACLPANPPPEGFSRPLCLVQLFHSHLMLQTAPAKNRAASGVDYPAWALTQGREHWLENMHLVNDPPREDLPPSGRSSPSSGAKSRVAQVQEGAYEALLAMGMRPVMDAWTEDKLLRIDLAMQGAGGLPKVAICIDGPLQFDRTTGRKLGTAYSRDRLLEARGWEVLSIPTTDWESARIPPKQQKYLKSRLAHVENLLVQHAAQ